MGGRGSGMGAAESLSALRRRPLPAVPIEAMPFTYSSNLWEVRARVRGYASRAGLPEARANDLVLAVSEVAANTFRHARSVGTLEIWDDGTEIVCEVRDRGVIADPLVGQRRPAADALAGHGLWLVHQLCDVVEVVSGEGGTTIRMRMAIREAGASG
jgi:anti-sigma regulatory factor (Ser/Thr protein kinase)